MLADSSSMPARRCVSSPDIKAGDPLLTGGLHNKPYYRRKYFGFAGCGQCRHAQCRPAERVSIVLWALPVGPRRAIAVGLRLYGASGGFEAGDGWWDGRWTLS